MNAQTASRGILIADDEEAICFCLARAMRQRGLSVTVAADGAMALEQFQAASGAIGLLLLDVLMPRYSGVEVSRIVRLWDPGVRVILMSAQANLPKVDGHADVVVAKPFELDMLLDSVFRLLNTVRHCQVS